MLSKNLYKINYLLIPLLIVGISLGYTIFPVTILVLLPLLFTTNRHTVGVFLLMYGGPLGGVIRAMYPILPVYGLLLELIGLFLTKDLISNLFHHNSRSVLNMLLALIFFGVFYILGPQDDFARDKYAAMCVHGFLMLFGYYVFEKSDSINVEGLAQILILTAICMFTYVIQTVGMTRGGIIDYNWFRDQFVRFDYINNYKGGTLVNYQHIGMSVLYSVAIYLSQLRLRTWNTIFYVFFSFQLVLVSGARQALLGVILIIALRMVVFRVKNIGRVNLGRIFLMLIGLFVIGVIALTIVQTLPIDVVNKTLVQGDKGRMFHYLSAIKVFRDNPLLGSGIGGFHAITHQAWPHNFVLELLCEMGIVGTIMAGMLLVIPIARKKQSILHVTASNQFYFLILVTIFVRIMVSSDLRESIEVFSAVFAITAIRRSRRNIVIS